MGHSIGPPFVEELLDPRFWESARGRHHLLRREVIPPEAREALLTTELFELYLSSCQNLDDGWVRVISNGMGRSPQARTSDNHLDLRAVSHVHRAGASLLLTRLQKRRPEIALCCRAVEESFVRHGVVQTAPVGANAYLTPPRSKGFRVHNDGHDVLVLQLEGEKHWSLYHLAEDLPLEGDPALLEEPPDPTEELVLRPGDVLYVPRGQFHAAQTRETHSLHITLSVHVLTQLELVRRALNSVSALRRDAPALNGNLEGVATVGRELIEALTEALEPGRLASICAEMGRETITRWEIVPDRHLRSAWGRVEPGSGTAFRKASGVFGVLRENGDGLVHLVCPGEKIQGPAVLRESLEFVLDKDGSFEVEEIPGPLTVEAKSALLEKLLGAGLVTVADQAIADRTVAHQGVLDESGA